jgi:competence protein ComEC
MRLRYQRGPPVRLYSAMVALDGDIEGEVGTDTQGQRYANRAVGIGHPGDRALWALSTSRVVAVATIAVVGVWSGRLLVALLGAAVVAIATRSWLVLAFAVMVGVGGVTRSEQSWAALAPDDLGSYTGWARMVDDPQPYTGSTRVIVEIEGERFEVWSRGRARQLRVREWRGGQWVAVSGDRRELSDARARRVAWQHVVGEFELDWASDVNEGAFLAVASNRVRAAIERAGTELPGDEGALFRGLVVGDDRDQPPAMIERFRASGLSHLTAVSGQNVSFLLAASGPLLRRLRPWARWAATVGLIAWFIALTRYEPSILRAGVMAGLSATAFVLGRERAPVRILAVAVTGLVLVDPLLVWSVGFWLSVGATFGVSGVGPLIAARLARLRGMRLFALPLGVTLGAQLGVVVPSVLVFGRLPLVSIPANLLAVPVAGLVMLYGLPAGLLAGWLPPIAPFVMFPARFGTRWVDTVAAVGARLEPDRRAQFAGWVIVAGVVVALLLISRNTAEAHDDLPADR